MAGGGHPGLDAARIRSAAEMRAQRQAGLAFAARWRREQPFKAQLDQIYSPPRIAAKRFPYPGHRSCAQW